MNSSPKTALTSASAILALVPAAALFFFSPSAAAQTARPIAVDVGLADLDAASPADARVAIDRIAVAARHVCEAAATHSPLVPREIAECRRAALLNGVQQLSAQGRIDLAKQILMASAE